MESYFLQPNQEATLSLYNGTFEKSENIITRDRIIDASIVGGGERRGVTSEQWKDQDSTITQLTFNTADEGTYVVGVSTKARTIELKADKFNDYLKHDGVLDMLAYRTENELLDKDALESYQKHVKAIYQVGNAKTDDWNTVLGYPIEFVPLDNPYESYTGDELDVQLLLDGQPLSNQLVCADYVATFHTHSHNDHSHEHHGHDHGDHAHEHKHDDKRHSHNHDHKHKHDDKHHAHDHDDKHHKHSHNHKHDHSEDAHSHTTGQELRTNDRGVITLRLPEDGIYYLRTIHMVNVSDKTDLTHESKWATLTFEVTHRHDDSTHSHDDHHHGHEHDHEHHIPTWIFVLGSLVFIGVLFLIFRKKS